MAGYALVEAVKNKGKFKSDYAIANELGIGRTNISNWKNGDSKPDAPTALKLADMAELSPREALKLLQGGFASVSLLIVTSVFMSLIYMHNFGVFTAVYTLCEIVRVKIMSFGHVMNRMILAPLQAAFCSRIYKPI